MSTNFDPETDRSLAERAADQVSSDSTALNAGQGKQGIHRPPDKFREGADLPHLSIGPNGNQTIFGSFITRGDKLRLNDVIRDVPAGIRIPFILHEALVDAYCFAQDEWWEMTPGDLSEALGIPERELWEIVESQDYMRFRQQDPPPQKKEDQLV
jgi:hypothetical protein